MAGPGTHAALCPSQQNDFCPAGALAGQGVQPGHKRRLQKLQVPLAPNVLSNSNHPGIPLYQQIEQELHNKCDNSSSMGK